MPMMVSPGLAKAMSTAWLACEPELGCTLAASAPNSCFDAVNGQLLDHVHVLAATVVALAGVAFGVLVGQLRALGFHDGGRAVVFAGDQLNVLLLALVFGLDGGKYFGIDNLNGIGTLEHSVNGSCGDESLRTSEGLPRRTAKTPEVWLRRYAPRWLVCAKAQNCSTSA